MVGTRVQSVSTRGKHLLIDFDGGLTLHTHLQMRGTWHRYRPGEQWRLRADRAVAVLETAAAVAVCFDAPTVELLETRALAIHPVLSELGPDLLAGDPDLDEVGTRLVAAGARGLTIAEALLDQRVVAGVGNVYRSEVLFIESVDPFLAATDVSRLELERVIGTSRRLLLTNTSGGARVTMPDAAGAPAGTTTVGHRDGRRWVYARAGRPCRRCGASIRSASIGEPPRRLYWCPRCQGAAHAGDGSARDSRVTQAQEPAPVTDPRVPGARDPAR